MRIGHRIFGGRENVIIMKEKVDTMRENIDVVLHERIERLKGFAAGEFLGGIWLALFFKTIEGKEYSVSR